MAVHLRTYGSQRAGMVLNHYDPDPDERLSRLLTDLAEWADDAGVPDFLLVATCARQRADERRRYIEVKRPTAELEDDETEVESCPECGRRVAYSVARGYRHLEEPERGCFLHAGTTPKEVQNR